MMVSIAFGVPLVSEWVLVALLAAVVATASLGISGRGGLAMAHDALPLLLVLAWVVLGVALFQRSWLLAGVAALLCVGHVVLIVPRITRNHVPRWVEHAPRLRLAVVNVFIDNATPEALAAEVVAAAPEVIVVAEWNPAFAAAFDAAGGAGSHPFRLFDPDDDSDYAVAVLSDRALLDSSRVRTLGALTLVDAAVQVGEQTLRIVGLNPMAAVDPGGFQAWEEQLSTLTRVARSLRPPFVLAGDLNTTTFRPATRRLLAAGMVDAHESLGKGLSASFKLSASGALAAPGAVVRLDHALLSHHVRAVAADDLEAEGSDHLPFVVTLAVRPERRPRRRGDQS